MLTAIVNGAVCLCTQGSDPCALKVTNHNNVQIDDQSAATVLDHIPGVNLTTFGTCKVTGSKCVPVTPAPWETGSATNVQVNDQLVLLQTDRLKCTVPGIITVLDPMQARNVLDA